MRTNYARDTAAAYKVGGFAAMESYKLLTKCPNDKLRSVCYIFYIN